MTRPTLAVTMGDPRGVGPEILVKALPSLACQARLLLFGHRNILNEAAALLKKPWRHDAVVREPNFSVSRRSPRRRCGEASLAYITAAVQAVRGGECDAIVTGPICKEHIRLAGSLYPGHTEMLAGLAGIKTQTFLMMVGKRLRVSLVTLHEPLARVPKLVTRARLLQAIVATDRVLRRRFKIRRPRLAVAGLNPHAGERGLFGREELTVLRPALRTAQQKGIQVSGPWPGDTVFHQALRGDFDVVVSMYHDQGLIPIKLLHFEDAVNMTLGLPFIRTSVDHGVAFDIAWKGKASPKSMIAAGKLAVKLVTK